MDAWRLIAERKIEEAMAEGAFEDLAGSGRPLSLDDDPFVDPSLRMAHRLLKNNGFAPAWILEGKEIEEAIHGAVAEWERAFSEQEKERAQAKVRELNRRIANFNLQAPSPLFQKLPVKLACKPDPRAA
jgi:hypothetical protein